MEGRLEFSFLPSFPQPLSGILKRAREGVVKTTEEGYKQSEEYKKKVAVAKRKWEEEHRDEEWAALKKTLVDSVKAKIMNEIEQEKRAEQALLFEENQMDPIVYYIPFTQIN
jgi:hypothetical protein